MIAKREQPCGLSFGRTASSRNNGAIARDVPSFVSATGSSYCTAHGRSSLRDSGPDTIHIYRPILEGDPNLRLFAIKPSRISSDLLTRPSTSTMDSDRYTLAPRSVHTSMKAKIHREPGNRFPGEWRDMRNAEDQNELQQATLREIISRYIALAEEDCRLMTERQCRIDRNICQLDPRLSSDDRIRLALAIAQSAGEMDVTLYPYLFEEVQRIALQME